MDTKKGAKGCIDAPIPQEVRNEFKIQDLEKRIKGLETSVRILDAIASRYAQQFGIKVEKFQNGLVIITQI